MCQDIELGLAEISRKKPLLKKRIAEEIEGTIGEMAVKQPAFGQPA
jgi:hypothetical protein